MRKLIAVMAGALLIGIGAACAPEAEESKSDKNETTVEADTTDEVSQGLGSQDASGDVKVVAFTGPDAIGYYVPTVEVTNNSSKTSDYYIEANIEDASGTVTTFTNGLVSKLQPGGKASLDLIPVEASPGSTVVITEVQRTESN